MTLLERNTELLRRIDHLDPIASRIEDALRRGKREQLLAGVDSTGTPYAPLAAKTRANPRRGPGGPLVADGASSDLIVHYEVAVAIEPGRLVVSAGWPFAFVRYLKSGTRKMPRRDPGGFRAQDLATAMAILKEHVRG